MADGIPEECCSDWNRKSEHRFITWHHVDVDFQEVSLSFQAKLNS